MKKIAKIAIVVLIILTVALTINVVWRNFGNYKNTHGYEAYISNCDNGYEYVPGFGIDSSWCDDKDARNYYNKNKRIWGPFLITDYKDGICINRYYGLRKNINIPETICGKPVVKIDGYLHKDYWTSMEFNYEVISAFANRDDVTLNIPSTVKYISSTAIHEFTGMLENDVMVKSPHIAKINVAKDNPYYSSENGVLFTKDKKGLLYYDSSNKYMYMPDSYNEVIPNYVEYFAPLEGIGDYGTITFGKNIKKIDCFILDSEGCDIKEDVNHNNIKGAEIVVHGYKGTAAENWAKEYKAKFVPIDK